VFVLVLAGCATAPTETTTTVASQTFEVRLTGNASATYVVTARLVTDPFENVTVTYVNGTNGSVAVPDQRGAYTFGPESGVTAVDSGEETVGGVFFEGTPQFSVTANDVPATGNAVFTVRRKTDGGESEAVLVAWGFVRCDGHVAEISLVTNRSGLTGVGLGCEL
jgi:hypothetical protein